MAEGMLLGAGLGAGSAMLTGQDPLKGAALGGAMGGMGGAMSSAPGAAGASSGAWGTAGGAGSIGTAGTSTGMGGLGANIGDGFSGFQDMTGLTNRDMTMMGVQQGMNAMQPEPQQQLQAAPVGQGISRPQVDLSQAGGSSLSSNPLTSGPGGMAMTPEQVQKLKQQGLL